jgi:hypothetical protein
VPLGKLKTERMVPVDSFVCEIVHRLRFFRSSNRSLPTDCLSGVPVLKQQSFASCGITYMRSAAPPASPPASSHTACGTHTRRRCFARVSACLP